MQRLLCALLILTNAISPFAHAGEAATAAAEPVVEMKVGAENCEAQVTQKAEFKYKPVGYVTGAIVNQLTSTTPLLFTQLYFRALGNAMSKSGFNQIANSKGNFNENITKEQKQRVTNLMEGKAEQSVQMQGRIATLMWEYFVKELRLSSVLGNDSDIKKAAANAYFDSSDDYILVHDFLLQNMTHKAEVIELIRLSLPVGVKMASEGLGGSLARSVFVTSTVSVGLGAVSFFLLKLNALLGNPAGNGDLPMLLPAVISTFSGIGTFIYTAPKSMFQKLQVKIMNYSNRRSLFKRGLISKEDGESVGLIKATFKDLGELRNQVTLQQIQSAFPIPPASIEVPVIETAMLKYANDLGQFVAGVSEFQNEVATQNQENAKQMGQPIYSLARLLQVKQDQTSYEIPAQSRVAIQEFADQLIKSHELLTEIEAKHNAILNSYDMHEQVLQSFYDSNAARMNDRTRMLVQQKLATLAQAKVALQVLLNVASKQKEVLEDDKNALDIMLNTISVLAGKNALTAAQTKSFNEAFWKLTRSVEKAHENDINDAEKVPTIDLGGGK